METDSIISAIVSGLVIGALARLAVPGRQAIGILVTLLVGVAGAFVGGAIAGVFSENFWVTLLVQVIVAAVLVAYLAGRDRNRAKSGGAPTPRA